MKKHLRELLENEEYPEIAALAGRKRRVLDGLFSFTFDPDPLIAWRAVQAMGNAADRVADEHPDYVLNYLRRLYWLLSEESGGIGWRAPETMAEIICHRPRQFSDYIPIVVSLLREMAAEDLAHFKPGILWAIGRLATLAETEIERVLPDIVACLDDADPQIRGMAIWCLWQTNQTRCLAGRGHLLSDDHLVHLYDAGNIERVSVRQLAQRALSAT